MVGFDMHESKQCDDNIREGYTIISYLMLNTNENETYFSGATLSFALFEAAKNQNMCHLFIVHLFAQLFIDILWANIPDSRYVVLKLPVNPIQTPACMKNGNRPHSEVEIHGDGIKYLIEIQLVE